MLNQLIGKTIKSITNLNNIITFETVEGINYQMYHKQHFLEDVYIAEIKGSLNDLVGKKVLNAEVNTERIGYDNTGNEISFTRYKISVSKAIVTIKWYLGTNGDFFAYTDVSFKQI